MRTLESAQRCTRSLRHPGSVPWVVVFCVLLCGLGALPAAAEQAITRTIEDLVMF